ncbi:MAG: hypothetical protein UT63_C0028G0006 [Candidatus Gottesmanbacteria bacterium GW2011_GWC2_39_8]|uniref:Uncharacterized protein n=1 Tax=Candidatus Gottesmanbacteria bacterium GW2011_GWC2_39_8 TaxID=1618450 RepID=A0A0G0T4X7_9BACT|nr:MAG: hypothetical protein UT63_C0028G0006 [Candidatus Gottesmanbacteria bacterium GW2011_GWC2_39_8]
MAYRNADGFIIPDPKEIETDKDVPNFDQDFRVTGSNPSKNVEISDEVRQAGH